MHELHEEFAKTTDKTKKAFCLANNVGLSTYNYWERKFVDQAKSGIGFISVMIESERVPLIFKDLVLEFPNGVKIGVESHDLSLIGQLIGLV